MPVSLTRDALFERLGQGRAARLTVVTPNRRLAQALQEDFDFLQVGRNSTAWEAPDILPLGAFVERLYEDALYSDLPGGLPPLLTAAQEQALWQEAVANSSLLATAETADECRKAWSLVHQWRIGKGAGNEDAQAFSAWSLKYRVATRDDIDAARLPDLVASLLKEKSLPKPRALVAYAFDILPPQTRELLAAFEQQGVEVLHCAPAQRSARPVRASFASAREELEKAAAWARARLEGIRGQSPNSLSRDGSGGVRALTPNSVRIGVVVPQLEQRRAEVQRIFSRVMQPGYLLPGVQRAPMPFNISIGIPLARYPVVALALSVLDFSLEARPFAEVSRIILSPFIGGAESELAQRAKLEVKLRRDLGASVSLAKLIAHCEGTPALRACLEKLLRYARENLQGARTASEWARHFSAALGAAGFPGERGLDSEEFQARAKWHEALGELSRLERVCGPMGFARALHIARKLCADTLFQPESAAAPIQVLGVLESAGLAFDHLWVSGLTDEAWPLAARANPFIPVALQKKAGIPQASPESSLALDRRITEGWARAAGEVVFSHFRKEEDRELAPSPLILGFEDARIDAPAYPRYRDLIFSSRKLVAVEDSTGPKVAARQVRGGTRVLADQAACPFRAFAAWRLGAKELEAPAEGLDAADRGSLLHALMKHLWVLLKSSSSLERDTGPAIDAAAAAAVKELGLGGKFADLEHARLARLARDWLDLERSRAPFEVVAVEERRKIAVAGMEFDARIDRMDKLAGGGHVLIDYKTSRNPTPKHWEPPRPHDPQLPLYAVSAKEEVAAVAFARVRPGEMRFMGFSRDERVIPGVKKYHAWEQLSRDWKAEAESLGNAFAAGDARVDPKHELATCRYCAMHTLCRVYEKTNPLKEYEEEGE